MLRTCLRLLDEQARAHGLDPESSVPLLALVLGISADHGYEPVRAEGAKLSRLIAKAIQQYLVACVGNGNCPVSELNPPHVTQAYLTLPSNCETPLDFHISATSWQQPTPVERSWTSGAALTKCDELSFNPVPTGSLSSR